MISTTEAALKAELILVDPSAADCIAVSYFNETKVK
jgi:hypothetical protein